MKIKQYLHITEPEMFLKGDYRWAFSIYPHESETCGNICCGEVEFDVDVDTGAIINVVSDQIDEKISELKTAIQIAENRKAELLALPVPATDIDGNDQDWDEQSLDEIAEEESRVFDGAQR